MKKYFSDIINFDNIDINKASLDSRRSEYQQVWDLYNAGETSIKLLQEKLQRSKSFIEKALKLGKELNQINYITQYDKGKANNEAILELWESGEFNLDTICEKVGVSKPIVCKYINKKYEETLDPFYTTKAIVVLYCIEEDLYYDKQYLNELYGVANAYASISKSIKRGGTYKGKHWKSIPIQQAYYNIRQGDKSQIIFKED